jgi:gamma-glutamylcyclotransferase (GGCT)/AIG2-like uncharacterized protein YtfP
MLLRIFVYGTLKQGQRNFARFCGGVLAIEPASVLGRLYYLSDGRHLSYGYPMLEVPPEHVLAVGSSDYVGDAARLDRASVSPAAVQGDWEAIQGEIHTFDDPVQRLTAMDRLEDFHPGGPSLYHRVLLRTLAPVGSLVWTYVAAEGRVPAGAERIGPSWPT